MAELFARYADGGVAIAELTRWMNTLDGDPHRQDPLGPVGDLGHARNPAYAGRACFGKTMRSEQTAGLNRTARLAGRSTPRHYTVTDRAREDWLEIPVPALVDEHTWTRVQRRLADNKRYASRNSRIPRCCKASGLRRLRLRLLPHLHQDHPRRSTTTGASAAMTTATSTAGSAATSRCAPTTSTPSSGTTSRACSPTRP